MNQVSNLNFNGVFVMEWTIEDDIENGFLQASMKGMMDFYHYGESMKEILMHPYWKDSMGLVLDANMLDLSKLRYEDMIRQSILPGWNEDDKINKHINFIVENDLNFGIMRMWNVLSDIPSELNIHILRNKEFSLLPD